MNNGPIINRHDIMVKTRRFPLKTNHGKDMKIPLIHTLNETEGKPCESFSLY